MPLQRYRELVRDWKGFLDAHQTPEPVSLRVRGTLTTERALLRRLGDQGFELDAIPEVAGYFHLRGGSGSVAQTLEHWLGHFHIQQAVMGLPSMALAPRPGDRVLDLCAAPGGKTTHLSELMEEEGPLVAVDPKEKRLRGLLGNVYRLGLPNILVIAADGRELPVHAQFDRVLVDAPCSGEGNLRRQGRAPSRSRNFTEYATSLQEALLRRAVKLTRPGGTLVYSTCTYAPEENELVVDRVLRDTSLRVVPIDLDGPHDPGVTSWQGQELHPELKRAWRVYPHHLDSGGLFMAKLLRPAEGDAELGEPDACARAPSEMAAGEVAPDEVGPGETGWSAIPHAFPGEEASVAETRLASALSELEHRFGYQQDNLADLGWMVRGSHIWVHTAHRWPVDAWSESDSTARWRVVSLGLRALRAGAGGRETPSSHFLTRWPRDIAPERRVDLSAAELATLLEGRPLPPGDLPTGPVALEWDGTVLGRGMVGRDGLRHELGKSYAKRLRRILEG